MPNPRTQATLDKVEYTRSLVEAAPSITQATLAKAIERMFGSGLNLQILSNLQAIWKGSCREGGPEAAETRDQAQ
jgi:hypothetical protein